MCAIRSVSRTSDIRRQPTTTPPTKEVHGMAPVQFCSERDASKGIYGINMLELRAGATQYGKVPLGLRRTQSGDASPQAIHDPPTFTLL